MNTALIGSTGFVGNTLLSQKEFNYCYHSTNIQEIDGKEFDCVFCAAAPAKKWYANSHPNEDKKSIDSLIFHLKKIKTKFFILISTVDVFKNPINVNEKSPINLEELLPYGYNRRILEIFIANNFKKHLIVRLPGLVGKGLKKNIIYDFKNNNEIEKIESDNIFQFYPMKNLSKDIEIAIRNNISLIHLTAAPVSVNEVALYAFEKKFKNNLGQKIIQYDFKTIYSELWGKYNLPYQYDKLESLYAIKEYAKL